MDLTRLSPEYLLRSQRFAELLEAVQEVLQEYYQEIGQFFTLQDPENIPGPLLLTMVESMGFSDNPAIGERGYRTLTQFIRGLWENRASSNFFYLLSSFIGVKLTLEDMGDKIMKWSSGRSWSVHRYQNATLYREGSLKVAVPLSGYEAARRALEYALAGFYIWYDISMGVVYGRKQRYGDYCVGNSRKSLVGEIYRYSAVKDVYHRQLTGLNERVPHYNEQVIRQVTGTILRQDTFKPTTIAQRFQYKVNTPTVQYTREEKTTQARYRYGDIVIRSGPIYAGDEREVTTE